MGGGTSPVTNDDSVDTTTQNLNLQGIDGTAIAGNEGDVQVNITDGGAIEEAFSFADGLAARSFAFAKPDGKDDTRILMILAAALGAVALLKRGSR